MGREFFKDELHLRSLFFPQPNQCDFTMILIPFTGLMAAFPTREKGWWVCGGWAEAAGMGVFFYGFFPLAIFPSWMPLRLLLEFSQGRFLMSLLANVLLAGECVERQPVIKLCCQEMRQQLTDIGLEPSFRLRLFLLPFWQALPLCLLKQNIVFFWYQKWIGACK